MTEHEALLQIIALKNQAPVTIDPARAALLVIDMQRNFVSPVCEFGAVLEKIVPGVTDGYFRRASSTVVPNVQRLQALFRSRNLPIIYTGTGTAGQQGRDLPRWLREFDSLGEAVLGRRVWPSVTDAAWQIDESVAPRPGERVLNKTAADPLNCTDLDQVLKSLGVESVVVTGLTTDVCVTATARECADRNYYTIVAEDACTTISEDLHRASLEIFSLAFGRVRTTEQIERLFSTAATA